MGTGSAGAGMLPLADRSIGEVVPHLDAGELSSRDLVEACLGRIERDAVRLNTFLALGREAALAAADAARGAAEGTCCLILDLHLPGLDGIEILERLRGAGATTPVILISARFDPATRIRADRAGALVLLEKPLREAALLDGIERALGEAIPASRAIA